MKTFEYRLYPNKHQRELLMGCLIESRGIYNKMLEQSIREYERHGKFLFKYDLCELWSGMNTPTVPASTVQCLADRLDKSFQSFLKRKKEGKDPSKVGFPRFKSANQWHSIHLRQYKAVFDLREHNRLRVPNKLGSSIKIKLHRSLEGLPKTCYLVLRADGHWYALIVCELESVKPLPVASLLKKAIGIDVGLKTFLTDSGGKTIKNPRFFQKAQKQLRIKQRRMCRRRKWTKRKKQHEKGAKQYQNQSQGYHRAARATAKQHLKIERQRRDFHHKQANKLIGKYRLIVVEDLDISNMVRCRNFSKSIRDVGWNSFIEILARKAENAGGRVVRVNPRFTSQECNSCGEIVQKSLSVRTHICTSCGYVADRDHNAARNVLDRGIRLVKSEKRAGSLPSTVKTSSRKSRG